MSTINLLPEDYVKRRSERRANVMCVALFAVVMAGVFGAAIASERNTKQTQHVRDRVNANYAKAAQLLAQIQQLEAQKREGIRKAKATAALIERVPRSYVLATITRALPKHAALTELTLKPVRRAQPRRAPAKRTTKFAAAKKKKQVKKPPEMVMTLEVVGWAVTDVQVARFITNLLGSPLLSSVNLDYTKDKEVKAKKKDKPDMRVREFKIIMELHPDVDVIDLVGTRGTQAALPSGAAGGSDVPPPVADTGPDGGTRS